MMMMMMMMMIIIIIIRRKIKVLLSTHVNSKRGAFEILMSLFFYEERKDNFYTCI
jgi:hypothetical protein